PPTASRSATARPKPSSVIITAAGRPTDAAPSPSVSARRRKPTPPACVIAVRADEHISRFNADADDPSQVPNHGVWPGLSLLLQSFLTSLLDLPDLADDKAQPRHIALQLRQDI